MPAIPDYNLSATEEAGLTRAKRRVIKNMESGIVKLTERPDKDLTDGNADTIATQLISQFEDVTALLRQVVAYFGSGEGGEIYLDQSSDVVKAMSIVIMTAKATARLSRTAKALVPMMRYMDLGILSDLKAVQEECHISALEAFATLRKIEFDDNVDYNEMPIEQDVDDFSTFDPTYDPNEPTGNTPPEDEYSIQSDPTDGPRSKSTTIKKRGRPIKKGSATDLLRLANQALRELEQREYDIAMRVEGLRLLMEQQKLDSEEQVPDELKADDTMSVLTDGATPIGREHIFKRIDKSTLLRLVDAMGVKLSDAMSILEEGYKSFNKFRQQRVFRATKADADVGNAIKTASGMYGGRMPRVMYRGEMYTRDYHPEDRRATEAEERDKQMRGGFSMVQGSNSRMGGRVYKIGGSTDILYEREGLPRFL